MTSELSEGVREEEGMIAKRKLVAALWFDSFDDQQTVSLTQ